MNRFFKEVSALTLVVAIVFMGFPISLLALPENPAVVSGDVQIDYDTNSMLVTQDSQRAIINWDSFSISQSNEVLFAQPGINAAVLNRVIGTD